MVLWNRLCLAVWVGFALACVPFLDLCSAQQKFPRLGSSRPKDDVHKRLLSKSAESLTQHDIEQLVAVAKDASEPLIMFGSDFGLIAPRKERYDYLSNRVNVIVDRYSSEEYFNMLDPTLQKLIQADSKALPAIHAKIDQCRFDDPALKHLIVVLGETGNSKSIELVIRRLNEASETFDLIGAPGIDRPKVDRFRLGFLEQECLVALYKLTGRKLTYDPHQWKEYWTAVGPFYESRQKNGLKVDRILLSKALEAFDGEPVKQATILAREQVVMLGRGCSKILLEELSKEKGNEKNKLSPRQYNLCWAIDELRGTMSLPKASRIKYFVQRLSLPHKLRMPAIEGAARLRALFNLSLADFSRVLLAADAGKLDKVRVNMMWLNFFPAFRLKYYAYTRDNYGVTGQGFAEQHRKFGFVGGLKREEVAREVKAAAPILAAAIRGDDKRKSRVATYLADFIGMTTPVQPEELILALRDAWLSNEEGAGIYGSALVRFQSPLVTEALRKGLFSKHESIVRTSANNINKSRFPPDKNPKIYAKLVELIQHESANMRFAVVRTLRNAKPGLLKSYLHQVANDPNDDVVVEVCYAIDKLANPMFAEVLVEIALNESRKENVRTTAIGRLGKKHFDSSLDEIKVLLKDERLCGWVLSAFVDARGKDAIPILMEFIKTSPGDAGLATQYLPKLTGRKYRNKTDWLDWWEKQVQ